MAWLIQRLGDPSIVTATDSLFVATTAADGDYLSQLARFVWSGQIGADRLTALTAREARARENALSSRVRGGYLARGKVRLTTTYSCAGCATRWPMPGQWHRMQIDAVSEVSADQVLVAAGWGRPRCYPTSPSSPRRARSCGWRATRRRSRRRAPSSVPVSTGAILPGAPVPTASSSAPRSMNRHPVTIEAPQAGGSPDLLADAFK